MSGIRAQRAILAAEFFWHGQHLSPPKVYDGGTASFVDPTLRNSGGLPAGADAEEYELLDYVCVDGRWTLTPVVE